MRNWFLIFIKKIMERVNNVPIVVGGVSYSGFVKGLSNVIFEGENTVPDRCNFSGKIKIGYRTTLGYNNFIHGNVSIGKYCQIGADVAIHSTNHPINYLSIYIGSRLFNGELKQLKDNKSIEIGNDVWIGHNALIIGNVRIGNGAIIAAGAVVTKNVPSYSIVGGVPAKVIKRRFSDSVCEEIENLRWWDMNDEELMKIKYLFFKNLKNSNSIYE